jgi:peptidoglycan-N-acetylglucosamine deacetylase
MGELLNDQHEFPGGQRVAVSLTFDLDADVGRRWRGLDGRMTKASEARYGVGSGLRRILALLARADITATFYVPGEIAEQHPDAVRAVLDGGHEIGHHGHEHLFNDQVSEEEQRRELERGLAALREVVDDPVSGYRSPGWELTPESFMLLVEHDFLYDSSCMGDDRPYLERVGSLSILELPVHWSLDDYIYYGFDRDSPARVSGPQALLDTWLGEFESALDERRHVTYTMHPELSGRGYRARALEALIDEMRARADVWFAPHRKVAEFVLGGRLSE